MTTFFQNDFPDVSEQSRVYEGLDPRTNEFHGPLCPNFVLNTTHMELGGEPYQSLLFTMPMVFGAGNTAAMRIEKDQEARQKIAKDCADRLQAIMDNDAEKRQIIQTRIEMCHYRNAQWQALLQFIDGQSHLNTVLADPDYAEWVHRFFDVSHQVWHKIQEMARAKTISTAVKDNSND